MTKAENDAIVASIPDLEGDELIRVGDSIYRYDRVLDINSQPKLVFCYHGPAVPRYRHEGAVMTTDRSDHAAEAMRLAKQAYSDDPAILDGIRAQVHATLALVEQQRIANLIAYAADVDVIRSGNHDLNDQIREALEQS